MDAIDLGMLGDFGTALLIGALIGIEREKRKASEKEIDIAGLRTFIVLALIGAIAGWLTVVLKSSWILPTALIAATLPIVAGYVAMARARPGALGITTEVAGIAVLLLGAMTTLGYREPAVVLAIVMTAVLAYKQPLHGMVGRIGWDDIFAGVRLLIATFIVLPLLPNRTIDPWNALNPYSLWLLVLLISGLSLVGYIGTRVLGTGRGTMFTGLTGGLVSSTAVTLAFSRQAHDERRTPTSLALASGMLIAWAIMFGRVVAAVLVVNRNIVGSLLIPFVAMGVVAGIAAWICLRGSAAATAAAAETPSEVPLKNPFSLLEATKFALFFAAVLLIVALVQKYWPNRGLYPVAAIAGLTDVDAITLTLANYAKTGDPGIAVNGIVIASMTNTFVKCGLAVLLGGTALRRPILFATGAIAATGVVTLGLMAVVG